MYKSICVVAVLLTAFAFVSGSKPAGASAPASYSSPQIVARGKLVNQTTTIPVTTILTPAQDGLYRLSVYATVSNPDLNSGSWWSYNPAWTDDGGSVPENGLLYGYGNTHGPFIYESLYGSGVAIPFEAKAGTSITYSVTQQGPPDNSAYSLYYTLERLE
jgi:hypothetical protein